jgi:hypothetical protein
MPNSTVYHPDHGRGEIVTYRRGGRVAIVDFASRPMPTHVQVRELDVDEDGSAADARRQAVEDLLAGDTRFEGSREAGESSRVLEAMRLGVVPDEGVDVYTVGRDVEISQVEADLERATSDGGAVRAFLGDYGTGKTHLLQLARKRALDQGFLTARVVLDPRETPPSHPKRVFRELTKTIAYPDQRNAIDPGLAPLMEQALENPAVLDAFDVGASGSQEERLERGMHLYLTPALAYLRALDADAPESVVDGLPDELGPPSDYVRQSRGLIFEWLEGHQTISNTDLDARLKHINGSFPKLYSLMDFRPWARIYGYLLSGLATLAQSVGYAGLAVFVDEAERYALLSRENRDFATYVFKALSFAAVGGSQVPFTRQQLEDLGGWGILKDLPPRYDAHPGLYTVFAMTPHEEGMDTLRQAIRPGDISELRSFDHRDYAELAAKVCDFYASAHPDWEMTESMVTRSTSLLEECRNRGWISNPRQAMKFLVDFLDIVRHDPDDVETIVRDIEQYSAF